MNTRFVTATGSDTDAINANADLANQTSEAAYNEAAASTHTFTVAEFINGIYNVTSGATSALTTPTAALIVAALKNAQVGSAFDFWLINGGSGTATMNMGSGVTAKAFVSPATGKSQAYKGIVTVATVGSEAVTLVGLASAGI